MEYRRYKPNEINRDRKAQLRWIIILMIPVLIGTFFLTGFIYTATSDSLTDAKTVSNQEIKDLKTYYFDEITLLDCYSDYVYNPDSLRQFMSPELINRYQPDVKTRRKYLARFQDADDKFVYIDIQTDSFTDLDETWTVNSENPDAIKGVTISACMKGHPLSDVDSDLFLEAYQQHNHNMSGETLNLTFVYENCATPQQYYQTKTFKASPLLFTALIFWVPSMIGITVAVRKRKMLKRYLEEYLRTESQATENNWYQQEINPASNGTNRIVPIHSENSKIYLDTGKLFEWLRQNPGKMQYEFTQSIPLTEKAPVIFFYEDGVKTLEYCLQPEGEEDFSGKYFQTSVRIGLTGNPSCPTMQMDGFISDTSKERSMTHDDIGYRMEGHFLACGGAVTAERKQKTRGQDLVAKGLKYPGYTTPGNVRLIGICPECQKSFAFHGYAYYMAQSDVAYSDDGMDCCEIRLYDIDKNTWTYETDGKTFRYYNSFGCPHCGAPYIDYQNYPQMKQFGVSGCVHLNRKPYCAQ